MSLGNKEIMGGNIKRLLDRKGIDQKRLANDLELPETTISSWINAKNYPRIDRIEKMANYFNVEKSDLIEDKSSDPKIKGVRIPVLGHVQAGIPLEAIENIIDYEEIPESMTKCGEYFGLKIKGGSMEPRFLEGDVVIVKKQPSAKNGEIVVVFVNDTDATVKQFMQHDDGISLMPLNSAYKPLYFINREVRSIPVKIIGKVVELRGRY